MTGEEAFFRSLEEEQILEEKAIQAAEQAKKIAQKNANQQALEIASRMEEEIDRLLQDANYYLAQATEASPSFKKFLIRQFEEVMHQHYREENFIPYS